jgi:hypothetical protein
MSDELSLENLGLIEDGDVSIDVDNLPEERSNVPREIPTPGATLLLSVPAVNMENLSQIVKPLPTDNGQRLMFEFTGANALKFSSGISFEYTIRGYERQIYDKGEPTGAFTSDLAKFLKACGYKGTLASKKDYLAALIAASGAKFLAENTPRVYCNPKKAIFKDGAKQEQTGCGAQYELKAWKNKKKGTETLAIPRDAHGTFQTKFECKCGAQLTSWPTLSGFKPVS